MPLNDIDLEKLEHDYFQQILSAITLDKQKMVKALTSKDRIKQDWINQFRRVGLKKQVGEMARGAERVFEWLMPTVWEPNTSPIGADLFFESYNAFIHIDIKTAHTENVSDFKGIVPVGRNQTSYKPTASHRGTPINATPHLPKYYHTGKPCLTYFIQIIYDKNSLEIIAVLLMCLPNGQLNSVYGNTIANNGKSKDESFRYNYKNNPYFQKLSTKENKLLRVAFIYHKPNGSLTKQQITGTTFIQ